MIANVKTKELANALAKLGMLPGRDAGSSGNSMLSVEASEFSGIKLCRTTLTSLARIVCEGDVEEDGKAIIPYLGLMDAMRACDGEYARLTVEYGSLVIISGSGKGEVKVFPENEIIPAPPALKGQPLHLEHRELMEVLKTCSQAAGTDRARPNLMGMAIRASNGGLQCFGTNGHRCHVARIAAMVNPIDPDKASGRDWGVLIPQEGLACIQSVFKDVDHGCNVMLGTDGVQFDSGEVSVRIPVSTDRPPFIDALFSESSSIKSKIQREPLLKAAKAVEPVAGDEALRIFITKDSVRVLANSSTTIAERKLPCESNESAQVIVTGKYLISMLECANAEYVELEINSRRLTYREGERDFLIMFRAIGASSPTPTKTRKK